MHEKIHVCFLSTDAVILLSFQTAQEGHPVQSGLGTTSPSVLLLSQCHFTWLTIHTMY